MTGWGNGQWTGRAPGYGSGGTPIERVVRRMLIDMGVRFRFSARVAGKEVDFLIGQPGRRGLLIEADGDRYHFDLEHRARRDAVLKAAGWEILHFWGSEITSTPEAVRRRIAAELEGVPGFRPFVKVPVAACKHGGGRRKWNTTTRVT